MIERWSTLFSTPCWSSAICAARTAREIIEEWRTRLTDISWFMRVLNESIARQANREDRCKGRFWEGDAAAILACMAYVDLNPIRAGMAETPEGSDFTAIQEHLRQFAAAGQSEAPRPGAQPADLLPFVGGEHADNPKGIAFTLPDYLQLVDWTGRVVRDDKRGAIPSPIQPIFQRMGLNQDE